MYFFKVKKARTRGRLRARPGRFPTGAEPDLPESRVLVTSLFTIGCDRAQLCHTGRSYRMPCPISAGSR